MSKFDSMFNHLNKYASLFPKNSKIRGIDLYNKKGVVNFAQMNNSYNFTVKGSTGYYQTSIYFNNDNEIGDCNCACPHYTSGHLCKHLYASVLKLIDILQKDKSVFDANQKIEKSSNKNSQNNYKNIEENINNSNDSLSILSNFKILCEDYDINQIAMDNFLNNLDLDQDKLAELFLLAKKAKPMELFLNHYENKLNEEFFKNLNLSSFPKNITFRGLIPYLLKHSNMLEFFNDESLEELFSHIRVPRLQDRITLFFLCLNLNQKRAITTFFLDDQNTLNFFQMNAYINYLKNNCTKEEILSLLDNKIKRKTLTRIEATFVYPYFNDEMKKDYDDFFKKNDQSSMYYNNYHTYYDYDNEYYYGLPLNRSFYNLLKNQETSDIKEYDLKILYYLREKLFTGDNKLIFGKRFKQLANSLFRTKYPDSSKIYCCLSIILEYGDTNSFIKDTELKAITFLSNDYEDYKKRIPELYELFFKLKEKTSSKEGIVISKYNQES